MNDTYIHTLDRSLYIYGLIFPMRLYLHALRLEVCVCNQGSRRARGLEIKPSRCMNDTYINYCG